MPTTAKPNGPAKRRAAATPKVVAENAPLGKSLPKKEEDDASKRKRSRSVLGCYTCRLRRKKCDEGHPACRACVNLCVKCEYRRPVWWSNTEQRKIQKERIKNKIKHTKLQEKNTGLTAQQRRGYAVPVPVAVPYLAEHDFNRPFFQGPQDPFASHLPTPSFPPPGFGQMAPYEVDIRTERQLFVNDIPTRCDTSISSFNTFAPPQLESTLPHLPNEDWMPAISMGHQHLEQHEMDDLFYTDGKQQQSFALMQTSIPVDDCDRPLLNHFVDNVLRLIFPVLETHQKGHERAQAVLQSLETNKSYLHCCLSVAAIHFKSTAGDGGDEIDHDIMRHRYEAISQLCQSLNSDTEHDHILEATLAMIFFHCSVGGADEYLPDIPWNDHFQAATSLIHKLDLPTALINCTSSLSPPPFNMTLASWIDILGATMLGKSPQFAHTYRTKHLSGTPSGLRELMGCDDRVMYLISEIACLDALKAEGMIDDLAVCGHVSALAQQLEFTEPLDNALEAPYSSLSGAIRPDQLTQNMTAVFRLAARIYLCSLVPGFDRNQPSNVNLVEAVCKALQYIPTGPDGYDRSLVWPLLITGAYASPATSFRRALEGRIISMGDEADFGSFGRMYRLLQEVWRLSDDPFSPALGADGSSDSGSSTSSQKGDAICSPALGSAGMRELKKRDIHWREVMLRNGWRYLLI